MVPGFFIDADPRVVYVAGMQWKCKTPDTDSLEVEADEAASAAFLYAITMHVEDGATIIAEHGGESYEFTATKGIDPAYTLEQNA